MSSSMKEYNIILLGETGSGKSLFINSAANYIRFETLEKAVESAAAECLIASAFEVSDSAEEEHVIEAGKNDGNERTEGGESFTIGSKSYKFNFGDSAVVRLIDTPGVGDTKGEGADEKNINNILNFINDYDNLHAIAIVMKSSENKMTKRFSYCLKMLLHNLNKSAVDNIVFILTHNNTFKLGRVKDVIEKFNKEELASASALKFDKNRVFCFENQNYEYLMATQLRGIHFDGEEMERQKYNWKRSSKAMMSLVKYVSGLNPYKVRETRSLNEARQFIRIINPFLPEVLQNMEENANRIVKYEQNLRVTDENVKNMESDESFKQIYIKIIPIDKAITFCTSIHCREVIEFGEEVKYHYSKKCCLGCVVVNSWRWWCAAMDTDGDCKVCKCPGDAHDRRYYTTMKTASALLTPEAEARMSLATSVMERLEIKIESLRAIKAQLLWEKKVLEEAEKKFAKFFRTHALVKPPQRKYLEGQDAFLKVMEKYEKAIERMGCISIDEFYELKATVLNLSINGGKIKEILKANFKGVNAEVGVKETVINYLFGIDDLIS